jgi:hypothetical protein
MVGPGDLLRVWQEIAQRLESAAEPVTGSELGKLMLSAVQRQQELLEQVVGQQATLRRDVVGRLMMPLEVLLEVLDESSEAARAQAQALEGAAISLRLAGELFDRQAALLEQATAALREPLELVRSVATAGTGEDEG